MKNKNNKAWLFSIYLALAFFVAVIFYSNTSFFYKNNANIAEWKTYINQNYGFGLRYPKNWVYEYDDSDERGFGVSDGLSFYLDSSLASNVNLDSNDYYLKINIYKNDQKYPLQDFVAKDAKSELIDAGEKGLVLVVDAVASSEKKYYFQTNYGFVIAFESGNNLPKKTFDTIFKSIEILATN
ncbi:hypothetical protein HYV44_00425 [Candidatus Microgenomates bacterium]|nr:hypothetical protein [Candidatus Microgenomates bacterium]